MRCVAPNLARLHTELAPEDIEVLVLVVHARDLHHMVADSRVRAVSTEHNVKLDLYARGEPVSILHQGHAAMKVGMDELMVEEQLYVEKPVEAVKKVGIESCPIDGEVGLPQSVVSSKH